MAEIRKAKVSGQFYPGNQINLKLTIENSFKHGYGPGLPDNKKARNVVAAICPHAGYVYSGMCAAHSFKAIKESGAFDLFIIIGFSHSGFDNDKISTLKADWETPLGIAEVDKEIVDMLIKETSVVENRLSIQNEHSIEVELPFLQYLYKRVVFVPLSVPHYCDFSKAAAEINAVLKKSGKKYCIIVSSDFTHYGASFDYLPFTKNIRENIKKLDSGAIEEIKKRSTEGFLKYLKKTGATICGMSSISLMLELIKDEVKSGELLKYYTSGEITDEYEHSVSYASIIFEKKE